MSFAAFSCTSEVAPKQPVESPVSRDVGPWLTEQDIDQHGTDPPNDLPLNQQQSSAIQNTREVEADSQPAEMVSSHMPSVDTLADTYGDDWEMKDLAPELHLEICSYSHVQDQLAMRQVCRSWRSKLSPVFLSQYVVLDVSRFPKRDKFDSQGVKLDEPAESGDAFERPLTGSEELLACFVFTHVEKNTKVLVLRHMQVNVQKFGMVKTMVKEKQADLIQIVLKDCVMPEEWATNFYWWLNSNRKIVGMLQSLVPVTRTLVLDNYTIENVFSGAFMTNKDVAHFNMPCNHSIHARVTAGGMFKKLPIVLSRVELDCRRPFLEVFHTFMIAVVAHCPPVSLEVREDVVRLCSVWSHCQAHDHQWLELARLSSA